MINDVNIIHYFIIRQLLDETIDFHLFRPGCQKFEGSSWAGVGPERIVIHESYEVGEWGAASNFIRELKSDWTIYIQ